MKKAVILSALVAVVGLAVVYVVTLPSDEELIRQAIDESTEASREGRSGGVLEYLSKSISFNGMPVADRSEISRYIRLSRPEVTFGEFSPVIAGDEATVTADVAVKMDFQGLNLDETIPGVEVKLAKETAYRWIFVPSAKWRITDVSAPALANIPGGM